MMRLLGLPGRLRSGSYNSALLRAAMRLMPKGAALEIATMREIPLYDGDVEAAEAIPAPVAAPKDQIIAPAGKTSGGCSAVGRSQ